MGRKRSSNNTDLVQPNHYIIPKNKKAKIPPPEPQPLPEFNPLPINLPFTNGALNILPDVNPTDPLTLFKLIQTDDLLKKLAAYINEYIRFYLYREYKNKSKEVIRP